MSSVLAESERPRDAKSRCCVSAASAVLRSFGPADLTSDNAGLRGVAGGARERQRPRGFPDRSRSFTRAADRRPQTSESRALYGGSKQHAVTVAQGSDHASLQMLDWDGTCLRERVARDQGCRRNWVRTTPRATPTNQPHQRAQPWVEEVVRSVNGSDSDIRRW